MTTWSLLLLIGLPPQPKGSPLPEATPFPGGSLNNWTKWHTKAWRLNSAPGQEDSAEDPVVNKEQSIFLCSLPFLQGAPKNPPQKTRCAQISLWICFLRNLIWGNSLDPSYIILYLRKVVSERWSDLFKRAQLRRNGSGKNILIPDPVKCPVLCCA